MPTEPATHTIATDVLDVAFLQRGAEGGPTVVFVHGFPDDASAWLPVMDALAERGIRSYAPFLRGFGPTRFKTAEAYRSGQVAALVADLVAFMDAVDIERATLVGHDWGARAAQGVAALHPTRIERLVTYGGYAISFGEGDGPPPYSVLQTLWYQHLFNMPFAEGILRSDAEGFARHLWTVWSPGWNDHDKDTAFASVRSSFNADFVDVVLSGYSYSERGYVPALAGLEAELAGAPVIDVPTVIIRGARDPLETPAEFANDGAKFIAIEQSITLPDAGHFAHRQDPETLIEVLAPSAE